MDNEKSDVLKIVGQNIKQARLLSSLTQEALAEKLNKSINFISLIERGASGVSITTLVDICNILKVDTSFIFKGLIHTSNTNGNLILSLSTLQGKDKAIVENLINYIIENK